MSRVFAAPSKFDKVDDGFLCINLICMSSCLDYNVYHGIILSCDLLT